jgi:hypothetical protein
MLVRGDAFRTGDQSAMPLDATDRSPTSTASWLATVLGSGITAELSSRNDDDFRSRLREVTFEALIFAVAAAAPDVARANVIELYRCWVACVGPGAPSLRTPVMGGVRCWPIATHLPPGQISQPPR